ENTTVRIRQKPKPEISTNGHAAAKNGASPSLPNATANGVHGSPATTVPHHVAIIMDGNGRWAKERGLSRQKGHRSGAENIRRVIRDCGERGITTVTMHGLST